MSRKDQQQDPSKTEIPDELASAWQYFASDFPNPDHLHCPSQAEIKQSIKSGKLPDDNLRQHLFGCSDCFTLYQELLNAHRSEKRKAGSLWQRISQFVFARSLILAPGLGALLVFAAVALYLTMKSPENSSTSSVNRAVEVVNANVTPTLTPSPGPTSSQKRPSSEPVNVARVDLSAYTLRRGSENNEAKPVQVQPRSTLFSITLPEGSPAGAYSVSLLNAFGKVVRTRASHSVDGKEVTATLNLNNLGNQTYRLCVSRTDEPPNCHPVQITNKGRKD